MNMESQFDTPTYDQVKYNAKSHIEKSKYGNGKSMMRNMYNVYEHYEKNDEIEKKDVPKYVMKRSYGGLCKVCGVRLCKSFFDTDRLRKKKNGSNSLKKAKGKSFVTRRCETEEMKIILKFDLQINDDID